MEALFGIQNHIGVYQECFRAAVIFGYGLVMVRLAGPRTFAQWSALDIVISIIVGSTLSRALTGNAPLLGTFAAVTVLFGLHSALAHAAARSERLSRLIEGRSIILIKNGVIDEIARLRHAVSKVDISEAIRNSELRGLEDLHRIERMELQPNGKLAVVKNVGAPKLEQIALIPRS